MSYFQSASAQGTGIGTVDNTTDHPNGVVEPGETDSTITDFRASFGYFNPIYSPQHGKSLSFDASGLLTIAATGPRLTDNQLDFAGVQSRFRIFPDSTGAMQWRVRFDSYAVAGAVAGSKCGFGCGARYMGTTNTFYYAQCFGCNGAGPNVDWFNISTADLYDTQFALRNTGSLGAAPGAIPYIDFRHQISWNNLVNPDRYQVLDFDYDIGGGYVNNAFATDFDIGYMAMNGTYLYLGFFTFGSFEVMSARLIAFELLKGYYALGG